MGSQSDRSDEGKVKPVRVLHCVKLLSAGGVERLRLSIFEELGPPRYEHKILCTQVTEKWVLEECRKLGVEVLELGPVTSILGPKRYVRAARIARDWRPTIIHGAIIEGYSLAVIAGSLARVPKIVLEETSDPVNRSRRATRLVGLLARRATVCVGVSRSVVAYLTQVAGVDPRKTRLLYNGVVDHRAVDEDESTALASELGLSANDVVLGTVSRLDDDHKRISDLLEAVSGISGSDIRLVIVGDGPDRQKLEQRALELGLAEQAIFVGNQVDVAPWYRIMDIFVLASDREAFGLVNVEAMLASLPVVATQVGGIPEIVEDGETGFLVPPRSPERLRSSILTLVNDIDLRYRLGKQGRDRAKRLFSVDAYIREVDRLYSDLVKS